jgi:hypothetical protein
MMAHAVCDGGGIGGSGRTRTGTLWSMFELLVGSLAWPDVVPLRPAIREVEVGLTREVAQQDLG